MNTINLSAGSCKENRGSWCQSPLCSAQMCEEKVFLNRSENNLIIEKRIFFSLCSNPPPSRIYTPCFHTLKTTATWSVHNISYQDKPGLDIKASCLNIICNFLWLWVVFKKCVLPMCVETSQADATFWWRLTSTFSTIRGWVGGESPWIREKLWNIRNSHWSTHLICIIFSVLIPCLTLIQVNE